MNEFDFQNLTSGELELAAREYHENGFIVLTGLDEITNLFPKVLAETTNLEESEIEKMLDPQSSSLLSPALRQRLSRVPTTTQLASSLLKLLKPLLLRFQGPVVHVSSDFHAQFKGGDVLDIGYPGFHAQTDYIEIHGPHLLHQDFAGASFPISPSMMTLWLALNTTSSWNLRMYPRSHKKGLLCNKFLALKDERLGLLGEPQDIPACRGKGILFNGLMLHGTGERGPDRRASCDIRFFPFCGFLPSEAHVINPTPFAFLDQRLKTEDASTFLSPLFETLVFLGKSESAKHRMPSAEHIKAHSPLNWVNYLIHLMQGEWEQGLPDLRRLVNTEIGADGPEVFVKKFTGHPVHPQTLKIVRDKILDLKAEAAELNDLDSLIQTLEPAEGSALRQD